MSPTVEQKVMETIAQSRIIQFIIGDDLTVFNVHEASIWGLSKLLDKELWRQTGDYKVTWKHVDVGTFATFLEYAYTGNFTVIDRGMKHKPGNEEPPSLGEYMASCELNDSVSVKYALEHFGQVLQQPCCKNNAGQASTLARENGPSYSRHYYLAHSRLYIFADNYDLEKLKSLCIEKMRQSLVGNPGQVELTHAVVDVLRLIWPQTEPRDAMRDLILRYILTDMSWMMRQPVFNKLLKEEPEISHELLFMVPLAYWEAL